MDAEGFFTSIAPYINTLPAYPHGELEQLADDSMNMGMSAQPMQDDEKLEVIKATTAHLTALAIARCQITSDAPHDEEPRPQFIVNKQMEIFGKVD